MIQASNLLLSFGAKTLKFTRMKEFLSGYENIITAYDNSNSALYSSLKVGKLTEFQEWKPHLLENK